MVYEVVYDEEKNIKLNGIIDRIIKGKEGGNALRREIRVTSSSYMPSLKALPTTKLKLIFFLRSLMVR